MEKRDPSKERREEHSRQRQGPVQKQNLELESEILGLKPDSARFAEWFWVRPSPS